MERKPLKILRKAARLIGVPAPKSASKTEREALANSTGWFHSIDLGKGVVTKGVSPAPFLAKSADIVFRDGVKGGTVLDIGAWDGFYSFDAKRRGATRVLATDWFCWTGQGWGTKTGFEIARRLTGLDVEDRVIDVPQISPESVGQWDLVLFLGVFYHLKNPFDGLERAASVAKQRLVVETHIEARLPDEPPGMIFYPGSELGNDHTNWWGPNPSCVVAMLKSCGFSRVDYAPAAGQRGYFHAYR